MNEFFRVKQKHLCVLLKLQDNCWALPVQSSSRPATFTTAFGLCSLCTYSKSTSCDSERTTSCSISITNSNAECIRKAYLEMKSKHSLQYLNRILILPAPIRLQTEWGELLAHMGVHARVSVLCCCPSGTKSSRAKMSSTRLRADCSWMPLQRITSSGVTHFSFRMCHHGHLPSWGLLWIQSCLEGRTGQRRSLLHSFIITAKVSNPY